MKYVIELSVFSVSSPYIFKNYVIEVLSPTSLSTVNQIDNIA